MRIEPQLNDPVERASALVRLFCPVAAFGSIRGVPAEDVPEPFRQLLDHRGHMTVAMERFHGTVVGLRVVGQSLDQPRDDGTPSWYAREILLESPSGRVLQHGIVRIDLASVDAGTAREIRDGRRPLGRILIEAGVLRDVHSVCLLEIVPGPHLTDLFGLKSPAAGPVYGRVAAIVLNGRPAVELLEIVPPSGC